MASVPRNPKHIHVLFVHGVGTHSHLSSLLQAYQALRSNIRSPEAPVDFENPFPDWTLSALDTAIPQLQLKPLVASPGDTQAVYFYEINYSALAGVLRRNQSLDITSLFVGFDLAVNVSRERLRINAATQPPAGALQLNHEHLAATLQKLASVFVAATVPILGIPSLLFRTYTRGIVATFTRFFEDIATFALDRNGGELINKHVDHTIERIHTAPHFHGEDDTYDRDEFVIAAHSLGTIVAHSYLVRCQDYAALPRKLLTFGSPIGLICWTWLLLDFPRMRFDPNAEFNLPGDPYDPDKRDEPYFWWQPLPKTTGASSVPLQWINVVNHLDPIATAFPIEYVNLDEIPPEAAARLKGGIVHQRYIRTGGVLSAGASHTQYFESEDFKEILSRMAGLRTDPPEAVGAPPVSADWSRTARDLRWLQDGLRLAGFVFIFSYLHVIARAYESWVPYVFLLLFMWPPLIVSALAFFQRLFFGWPTKRTSGRRIDLLPWNDWFALPYWLRRKWVALGNLFPATWGARWTAFWEPDPRSTKSTLGQKLPLWTVSFLPSTVLMLTPAFAAYCHAEDSTNPFALIWDSPVSGILVVALFMLYIVAFAVSEFAQHWRDAVIWCTTATKKKY